MARVSIAIALVAGLTLFALPSPANAVAPGFDSAYAGESAFVSVIPGQSYQFQVFFMNTGVMTWRKGTSTQVNLTICLENKVSCNLPSPNADWNDGSWLSERTYATHSQSAVAPIDVAAFTYSIKVPLNAKGGIYRFNGDLALTGGQQLHPEGYYHEATLSHGP